METRFEIARQIGLGHSGLFKLPDDTAKEPAPPPDVRRRVITRQSRRASVRRP
jgi:hypothetical protein